MSLGECERCGAAVRVGGRGRPQRFCSAACKQAAYRARRLPELMRGRRWVRSDGKRPITPSGRPASSTNPATWSSFAQVRTGAGDGFGIMLGDGLGCYDLDGVTDAEVRRFAATVPEPIIYAERSVSGRGAHLFISASEGRGSRRMVDGLKVERYTRARFIRTTLERIEL